MGFRFEGRCSGRGLIGNPHSTEVWTDGQRSVRNRRGHADFTLECLHDQHASVTAQHHVVQNM